MVVNSVLRDNGSFDPDDHEREVVRLWFHQDPRLRLEVLRYDLESGSTLLAVFAWLGSSDGAGTFRRTDWEREFRVVRLHYGWPFRLDVVVVEVTVAVLGGIATLALCFERVASGLEKLSSGQKLRAEARQLDRARAMVDGDHEQTAIELSPVQAEKLRELMRQAPSPREVSALAAGRTRVIPDRPSAVGRAFRKIALRGGRIKFRP